MALTYAGNYSDAIKRMRRYQGRRFGTTALGHFQYAIWSGQSANGVNNPGCTMIIDRTKTRIPLLPGVTPTDPFAVAVLADLRISTDAPGFAQRG